MQIRSTVWSESVPFLAHVLKPSYRGNAKASSRADGQGMIDTRQTSLARKACALVVLVTILAVLSGCAFRADLTLYQDERWEFISTIELTYEEESGILGASVQNTVAEWEYEQRPEGIAVSSERKEGTHSVRYLLKAEGKGYDQLQHELDIADWIGEVRPEPNGTVYLSLPAPGNWNSLARNDFYLHAGKIIETNAPRIEGNTAVWTSADVAVRGIDQMTAVVKPRSQINLAVVAGGVVVAALLVVMAVRLIASRSSRSEPDEYVSDW
ncbi:MAG: hypothetical protein WA040_19515 [Anaerolineae bacterium]